MAEVFWSDSSKKELKSVMEQIEKQQITVGKQLQSILLSKRKEEGKEVKTVREYMPSQRDYVYETWRASNIILTILLKDFLPEIALYRHDEKSQFRKTMDGQQRLTSIYRYINNMFRLDLSKSIHPVFTIEGERYTYQDLQGKLFSELPEIFRDIILNYELRIAVCNNCTDEQAERYYVTMNSGVKTLRPAEIRTAAMGASVRKFFTEVLKSDWVLHTMTEKATISNAGREIIAQVITLLYNKNATELSKENIDKVIYSFRDTGVPEELQNDIINICNYLNEASSIWIENKKKEDALATKKKGKAVSNYSTYRFTCFNKTHIVMLMMSAEKAIKNNVPVSVFATWALEFFKTPSQDYKDGLVDKAIDLKMVELRMWAIDAEIEKLEKEEVKQVKLESESKEQSNDEQDQSEQPKSGDTELLNAILETIDNVAATQDSADLEPEVLN